MSLIAKIIEFLGRSQAYFILLMTAVTFVIVVLRYFFNLSWTWLQEIVVYAHAFVITFAGAYTLAKNAQVRVDLFYRNFSTRAQAGVNLFGSILFLLPMTFLIGYYGWPFALDSWKILEGSKDGGGLEAVFLLKSSILVFAFSLAVQALLIILESVKTIRHPDVATTAKRGNK